MHKLRYRISTLSPLLISARYGDMNMVRTLQHIPGKSILGMLASRFIKQKKINGNAHLNDDFYSYFLKGNIRFGNAYIVLTDEGGNESVYYPIPISIQEEKRGNQIYDLLMMDEDEAFPDKQTKAKTGFCRLEDENIRLTEVKTSLNFHHARDPETGTSKEGQIFNYESIAEGQVFEGFVTGNQENLKKLFDVCGISWIGHIGRSKNAQYGKVSFEISDQTPVPVTNEIKGKEVVSLTFLSDTILYNDNGYATTDIKGIEHYLGIKINKSFIRQEDMESFVGVWRLKKPSETCFKAGSCFLLNDITDADITRIFELQKTGIGERAHEGFGQFAVGLQTVDELNEKIIMLSKPQKPEGLIPQKSKEILKILIQNAIQKEIVLDAMREMDLFRQNKRNKLPSNSLIGRLHAMAEKLDRDAFVESIKNKMRKTAKDQLESCRNGSQTLLDFLERKIVTVNDAFRKASLGDLKTMCQEINYSPENDNEFKKKLHHAYFTTFFSMMRKTKTKEVQND